tara:strand:+ start:347 stop:1576 length:1230 start_codon:yes stop_codon:yes gene_type:complete
LKVLSRKNIRENIKSLVEKKIRIDVLGSITSIKQKDWDLCACPESFDGGNPYDPFTTYDFLSALELSGSVGKGTGWHACHLVAKLSDEIVAVMPLYIKGHSQGEYIFDHNWAHAFESAGGRYYPKLQSCVPFTPATGRRFLTKKGFEKEGREALTSGLINLANQNKISSAHITFCTLDEAKALSSERFLLRKTMQFHWEDKGFQDFNDFLDSLTSRKRKAIKKERSIARSFWNNNGEIVKLNGSDIEPKHWESFWFFYQDTGNRKWGYPYLTKNFFEIIHKTMTDKILLVLAMENDLPIAGALNFLGRDTLFGRYWGASKYYSCLHYEICYYQAIDYVLENGLRKIEAGAQGDHKLSRGYLPNFVYSLHWFLDEQFGRAVNDYLNSEGQIMSKDQKIMMEESPFRKMEE